MKTLKDAFIKAHKENPEVPRPPTEEEFYKRHLLGLCPAFTSLTTDTAIRRFLRLLRIPALFDGATADHFNTPEGAVYFPPDHITFFKTSHEEYSYFVQAVVARYTSFHSFSDPTLYGILVSYTKKKKDESSVFHRVLLSHDTFERRIIRP